MRVARALGALIAVAGFVMFVIPPAARAATANVSVGLPNYSPASVTIEAGESVIWTSTGDAPHSVTSDQAGLFDSSPTCSVDAQENCMEPGEIFSTTFTTPGGYTYHCRIHSSMVGVVNVTPKSTTTTTQATTTTRPTTTSTTAATTTSSSSTSTSTSSTSTSSSSTSTTLSSTSTTALAINDDGGGSSNTTAVLLIIAIVAVIGGIAAIGGYLYRTRAEPVDYYDEGPFGPE